MPTVTKAIIPVAGLATRQFPASAAVPKPLFPILDRDGVLKPVVQVIIEEAIDSGIKEICIVTPPGGQEIYRSYFRARGEAELQRLQGKGQAIHAADQLRQIEPHLAFVDQHEPAGFGDAVYRARHWAGESPFLLLLGDHVYISTARQRCARQLLDSFEAASADAVSAVQLIPERQLHLLGIIRGRPADQPNTFAAEAIVEKPSIDHARAALATPSIPAGNYLAHFGLHVFSPSIFDSLEALIRDNVRHGGEVQLTAAQEHLRAGGADYLAVLIQGYACDTGTPLAFLEAQLALGLTGIHRNEVTEILARTLSMHSRF